MFKLVIINIKNKQSKINFRPCCFYRYKINDSFWVIKEASIIGTHFDLMVWKFQLLGYFIF